MKILHLFGRMTRHGAQLRTIDVTAMAAAEDRHDFCSLSGSKGELDEIVVERGGKMLYLPIHTLSFAFKVFRVIRKNRYDVVHSHVHHTSGFILLIARLAGVRGRIAHYRNTTTDVSQSTVSKFVSQIKRSMVNWFATDILAVSDSSMRIAWAENWQADARCRVIYNGVPEVDRDRDADRAFIREEFGIGDDARILIHLGRFDRQKNHLKCLRVFKSMIDAGGVYCFLFAGDTNGQEEKPIFRFIADNKLENYVRILGVRDDVLRLLNGSDLMLFPSRWEGLPGSVLESLSVGTQVLGSDIEPIKEIAALTSGVTYLAIDNDDTIWAKQAAERIAAADLVEARRLRIESFRKAPFSLPVAYNQMHGIWAKYG